MNTNRSQAISAAVLRLLRPLVHVLLRNGMPFGAFADLVKRVYVDVALEEFVVPGRKQTISRVSILTGLSRKEVLRVTRLPAPDDQEAMQRYNRAARVLTAWVREREFHDRGGRPAALPLEGEEKSFAALVKRFAGDVPVRAILDELTRVGAVERLKDGRIRLRARAYVPAMGETDKLGILGTDVSDLISTIDHNLHSTPDEAFFQRKVSYDNLPAEVLPEFRSRSGKSAQGLLERLDRWLSERDRDVNPAVKGTGRKRAGIGIFYFEEDYSEEDES
ncbi:MAG: hypothetical protein JSU72_17170 [Deltaproteobacteria bacterium]|nr:MAG: hypothetical protein JSU72_17170 [Deltaproteobacteria bacterium]